MVIYILGLGGDLAAAPLLSCHNVGRLGLPLAAASPLLQGRALAFMAFNIQLDIYMHLCSIWQPKNTHRLKAGSFNNLPQLNVILDALCQTFDAQFAIMQFVCVDRDIFNSTSQKQLGTRRALWQAKYEGTACNCNLLRLFSTSYLLTQTSTISSYTRCSISRGGGRSAKENIFANTTYIQKAAT